MPRTASQRNDLDIVLRDLHDHIEVTLHYRVYPEYGILRRTRPCVTARAAHHTRKRAIRYLVPASGRRLSTNLSRGPLGRRDATHHEPIHEGQKILESREGTPATINPWFAIDPGDADEEHGRVWFGALGWSGNWRIAIEQTPYRQVRVTGGFNSFDFAYPLKPGESLETPMFYGAFTDQGFGEASRLLHRFEREQILPGGLTSRLRPVLYNSWEATHFEVNEPGQKELAESAAKLGVELFVMDDGWFGKRNNDRAGLGDWFVNPQKFPQGLKGLIDPSPSWAWTSVSGSSPRWSTPTAISTAHIPTG